MSITGNHLRGSHIVLMAGVLLIDGRCMRRLPIASLHAVERPTSRSSRPFPAPARPRSPNRGPADGAHHRSHSRRVEMSSYSGMGGASIVTSSILGRARPAAGCRQAALNAAGPDLPKDRGRRCTGIQTGRLAVIVRRSTPKHSSGRRGYDSPIA